MTVPFSFVLVVLEVAFPSLTCIYNCQAFHSLKSYIALCPSVVLTRVNRVNEELNCTDVI